VLSSSEGPHSKEFLMQGATVTLGDFGTFPIAGLAVDYAVGSTQSQIEIGAGSNQRIGAHNHQRVRPTRSGGAVAGSPIQVDGEPPDPRR
jgi:hypothetical protein